MGVMGDERRGRMSGVAGEVLVSGGVRVEGGWVVVLASRADGVPSGGGVGVRGDVAEAFGHLGGARKGRILLPRGVWSAPVPVGAAVGPLWPARAIQPVPAPVFAPVRGREPSLACQKFLPSALAAPRSPLVSLDSLSPESIK